MSNEYSVESLCTTMNISRSGYYKWLNTRNNKSQRKKDREILEIFIKEIHNKHKSWGYHSIAADIKNNTGWLISDNLVHKVCKKLNIRSLAKHYKTENNTKKNESKIYPNIIGHNWTTTRPFEIVTSDSTVLRFKGINYDWTYYLDIFDQSIVGSDVKSYYYGVNYINHVKALKDMLKNKKKRGYKDLETIFHSDQGAIYASVTFNDVYKNDNIKRSMSRAGTPTDNPYIESKNGWLKAEIPLELNEYDYKTVDEYVAAIIDYNNNIRYSYALKYKTPVQFRTEQGFN